MAPHIADEEAALFSAAGIAQTVKNALVPALSATTLSPSKPVDSPGSLSADHPNRAWIMGREAFEKVMPHHQGIKELWETKWQFPVHIPIPSSLFSLQYVNVNTVPVQQIPVPLPRRPLRRLLAHLHSPHQQLHKLWHLARIYQHLPPRSRRPRRARRQAALQTPPVARWKERSIGDLPPRLRHLPHRALPLHHLPWTKGRE